MIPTTGRRHTIVISMLLLSMLACSARVAAENIFDLNFQSVTDGSASSFFNIQGTCEAVGGSSSCGQTPFIAEVVTDPGTSQTYYHMVLGSAAEGFVQEVYIQNNGAWGVCQGGPMSASAGVCGTGGNNTDPLDVLDGATPYTLGTGTPTRVIMRQVMTDSSIATDFTKASFNDKPVISQDLTSTDMASHLVLDMSNSDYSTSNIPATITYTVSLTQGGVFDFARDVQNSDVTAGRYTYTDGAGRGGSSGTYNYVDGSANITTVKWEDFWDTAEANPWINNANRP